MADKIQWEYRVVSVGSFFGTKDELIEAKLNELGAEGWEIFSAQATGQGDGRIKLIAKRVLDASVRRRRAWDGT